MYHSRMVIAIGVVVVLVLAIGGAIAIQEIITPLPLGPGMMALSVATAAAVYGFIVGFIAAWLHYR